MDVSIELQKELIEALKALSGEKSLWESPFAVGLLTTFAVITATAIERWQAYHLQERQSDIDKQLQILTQQMEALKSLSQATHSVTPNDEPMQGSDSHEWLSPIVSSLSSVIRTLDDYLKNYSHITPTDVIPHIRNAINIANDHKWGALSADNHEYEPSSDEIDGVLNLIKELNDGVEKFKKVVGVTGA
jgi:hypothetical protein